MILEVSPTKEDALHVAKGSLYLVVQNIVTTFVAAVAFGFVARILTQTEMGVTVALTIVLGITQILSDLGLGSGIAKYIAEYRGRKADYTLISSAGVVTKISMAILAAISLSLISPQLSQSFFGSDNYSYLFQLLSVDIFFACINSALNNVLLGLNKITAMSVLNVIAILMRQLSIVTFLVIGYGLPGLLIGWIIGDLSYVVLSGFILLKGKHIRIHPANETISGLKMLVRFSWPLFLTNIILFTYNWFDRAILLTYTPLSEVAVYSVAFTAFGVLHMIPTALSTALFPYLTEQYGKDDKRKILVGVNAGSRYIALFFTPLAFGLMVTANPVLAFFAGERYAVGDVILSILSLASGVAGVAAAFGVSFLVYNMTSTILIVNIASIGLGTICSYLLLPFLGTIGIAISRGAIIVAHFIFTVAILKRRRLIALDKEAMLKGWGASVLMALTVGLISQICASHYLLPIYILLGGVAYLIALRLLSAVNEEDIRLLRSFLGRKGAPIAQVLEKIVIS